MADLAALEQRALGELKAADTEDALRTWRTKYFGDQGEMKQAMRDIGNIPKADRPAYGQEANRVKETLTRADEEATARVKQRHLERSLQEPPLDVTLPGRPAPSGRLHVATQIM